MSTAPLSNSFSNSPTPARHLFPAGAFADMIIEPLLFWVRAPIVLVCFNKSLVYGRVFFIETDFLVFKNNLLILVCAHCVARCSVMSDSFATPWTVAHQIPLSMGFPRQEYWSRLPFSSPGDLPDPGIKPWSPALQADSLPS